MVQILHPSRDLSNSFQSAMGGAVEGKGAQMITSACYLKATIIYQLKSPALTAITQEQFKGMHKKEGIKKIIYLSAEKILFTSRQPETQCNSKAVIDERSLEAKCPLCWHTYQF